MEELTDLEEALRLVGKEEFSLGKYYFNYEIGKGTYQVYGGNGALGYLDDIYYYDMHLFNKIKSEVYEKSSSQSFS